MVQMEMGVVQIETGVVHEIVGVVVSKVLVEVGVLGWSHNVMIGQL